MKFNFKLKASFLILAAALTMTACDDAPKGDNATITDQQAAADASGATFTLDTTESKIRFIGHGVGKNHPGKLRLSSGTVSVENNQISGGEFLINIKSMEMEEEGAIFRDKLRPHLLSGDFFDAEKFGNVKFVITSVTPYERNDKDTSIVEGANFNVSGNLTIKDETKNITFPAHVELDGNTMKAKANFDIDRTQWKMNYNNDKTLGDKFIESKVNIELDLKAEKKQSM